MLSKLQSAHNLYYQRNQKQQESQTTTIIMMIRLASLALSAALLSGTAVASSEYTKTLDKVMVVNKEIEASLFITWSKGRLSSPREQSLH